MSHNIPETSGRFPFPGEKRGQSRVDVLELVILEVDAAQSLSAMCIAMEKLRAIAHEIRLRG